MRDDNDIPFSDYTVDYSAIGSTLFGGDRTGAGISSGGFEALMANWIDLFVTLWSVLTVLSLFISAVLIFGIIYAYVKAAQYSELETEYVKNNEKLYAELYGPGTKNTRWQDIEEHISSDRPNDWKLSIIEADIMLGELLEAMGLGGDTIGERLKSASPSNFKTLDQAWRAHRVRNQIAHAGADFVLTKKTAQETIGLYHMVFKEFELI